ncbi:MAG: Asparaginyl-tRNA synthetase [Peltula sp. TS41687]|nr:MAG: Asparaginyl-tRNA synthetase [Peltula sp. TS41687]
MIRQCLAHHPFRKASIAAPKPHLILPVSVSRQPPQRLHHITTTTTRTVRSIVDLLCPTDPLPFSLQQPQQLTVNGYVRSVRRQKRVAFAVLGDGSTTEPLQVVLTPEQAEKLSTGTGVKITGRWERSPEGKKQRFELHADEVMVLGLADAKKYHSAEYLRTIPHLRTRTPFNSLLLRLRSLAIARLASFFTSRGFFQTHPPILSSSDAEGAGEVFGVTAAGASTTTATAAAASGHVTDEPPPSRPFFRSPRYLTVSSQLHLEALAQSVEKVWTLTPTFRAERSDTARHLSEFYMLEAEVNFVDDLSVVMDLVEEMLRELASFLRHSDVGKELRLQKRNGESPEEEEGERQHGRTTEETLLRRWDGLASLEWPRITYTEAIRRLEEAVTNRQVDFEHPPSWHSGLQAEHERFIAHVFGQDQRPVFVTDFPMSIKPFYMAPSRYDTDMTTASPPTAACFDLLLPDLGEVAGGSLREHRLDELLRSMREHGLKNRRGSSDLPTTEDDDTISDEKEFGNLSWYVDLRRWGSVPHGGFGLGFDRLLSYLAGVPNIKEMVTFPRWFGRCDC